MNHAEYLNRRSLHASDRGVARFPALALSESLQISAGTRVKQDRLSARYRRADLSLAPFLKRHLASSIIDRWQNQTWTSVCSHSTKCYE
jgi:hypothetical protein